MAMSEANLTDANVTGSVFRNAQLFGARFKRTKLNSYLRRTDWFEFQQAPRNRRLTEPTEWNGIRPEWLHPDSKACSD